jgi:hypothetical protein
MLRIGEAYLDWHIFETAGKYAGLGGIAVIVLLYIFRQILKLQIFKNVGSKGTLIVINNIINKVFWVTIVALLAWLTLGLFGKSSHQSSDPSANVAPLPGSSTKAPKDEKESIAESDEEQGDIQAANGISKEYCFWHKDCDTGFQNPFYPSAIADHWQRAKFYWQSALGLTSDPIRHARLIGKVSPENGVSCTLNDKTNQASCTPIPEHYDEVTVGSVKHQQLRAILAK